MFISKLRVSGFKSFSEDTTISINTGLNGIIGPNGSGKSNVVEAIKWVMGENSSKSLRGSGMNDLIFNGSASKASKNIALVSLTLEVDKNILEDNYKKFIKDNIIEIDDNFISTTVSDENLELRATAGSTVKSKENLRINQNLTANSITSLSETSINGSLVQVGNRNQLGNLTIIGNITATTSNIESEVQFDDILINDNVIESVDSNANLELTANASGKLIIPANDFEVNQNLNIGSLTTGNINIGAQLALDEINLSSDIKIFDNVITTTNTNSNLELRKINPAIIAKRIMSIYSKL